MEPIHHPTRISGSTCTLAGTSAGHPLRVYRRAGRGILSPVTTTTLDQLDLDQNVAMRRYTNFDDMKADEYQCWQSRPAHERLDALEEMIQTAYEVKGWELEPDVPRLQRLFVRLPCP